MVPGDDHTQGNLSGLSSGFKGPPPVSSREDWEVWREDLRDFCTGDRREGLVKRLAPLVRKSAGLQVQVWKSGGVHFHLSFPSPKQRPLVLVAHYDSVPGTPGANDNAASVFHLLRLAERFVPGECHLHILFTDKEELTSRQTCRDQGIYHLGPQLEEAGLLRGFFMVLDMTGIGDIPVLGCGTETSLKSRGLTLAAGMADAWRQNRLRAQRLLGALDSRGIMELPTSFSDDLGLLALGIPAVQLSLLPWKQALECRKTGKVHPPAWAAMHTPADTPDTLDKEGWLIMNRLLDLLVRQPLF